MTILYYSCSRIPQLECFAHGTWLGAKPSQQPFYERLGNSPMRYEGGVMNVIFLNMESIAKIIAVFVFCNIKQSRFSPRQLFVLPSKQLYLRPYPLPSHALMAQSPTHEAEHVHYHQDLDWLLVV